MKTLKLKITEIKGDKLKVDFDTSMSAAEVCFYLSIIKKQLEDGYLTRLEKFNKNEKSNK